LIVFIESGPPERFLKKDRDILAQFIMKFNLCIQKTQKQPLNDQWLFFYSRVIIGTPHPVLCATFPSRGRQEI